MKNKFLKNKKTDWSLIELNPKEIVVGILFIVFFIFLYKWYNSYFTKKNIAMDEITVIRPNINELTIQEFELDLNKLQRRLDNLNNKFLTEDTNIMKNDKVFRSINKVYLELRLRLNHIKSELTLEENKKFKTKNIDVFEKKMKKLKNLLDLLNEELQRETEKVQASRLGRITLIQLVFLPLGFIAAFFGMNFSSPDGKKMFAPLQVKSNIGLSTSQIYIILGMIFSSIIIGFLLNVGGEESFDIMETQKCNETREEIPAYNEELLNAREETMLQIPKKFQDITELPVKDINFYSNV